jgi:gentisate 1,2-dioxygenase
MAKKRVNNEPKAKESDTMTWKDALDPKLIEKLKATKKALETEQQEKRQEEEKKRIEERRLKEKNKSFEELLNESPLNWKSFKS